MMDISKDIASKINVVLINNKDLDNSELLDSYSIAKGNIAEEMIESYRYAFALEAEMILYLRSRSKSDSSKIVFQALEKYLFEINCNSFFVNKPVDRISKLFDVYIKNKNITGRIAEEIEDKPYPDSGDNLIISENQFKKLFYEVKDKSVLYIALY